MDLPIYYNTAKRAFMSGPLDGTPFKMPPLFQGDTPNLIFYGRKPNPDLDALDKFVPDDIAFTGIKAGIGIGPDAAPPGGTFKVRMVGTAATTAALPYNVSQADMLTALNALPAVSIASVDGVRLDAVAPVANNLFLIRWVDPTITHTFEVVENRLEPLCFDRSIIHDLPGGQMQEIKLIVAPFAFTDQFSYPQLAPVVVGSLRIGTTTQNCIQGIIVPQTATGSVDFSFASNATSVIPVASLSSDANGSAAIAGALNGLYSDNQTRFSVTKQARGKYYVEFVGPLAKTDEPLLGIAMHDQTPANTPVGFLSLKGPGVELALHTQPQGSFVFEVEITNGDDVTTVTQSGVTIINDMLDAAMVAAADPNWLLSANPEYPPYDPANAAIMVPGAYIITLGGGVNGVSVDGTGRVWVITHNLDTADLLVMMWETGGTRRRVPDDLYETLEVNSDQVQITFPVANFPSVPAPGQFRVVISAVKSAARALPGHHHAIGDIDGLQAALDELRNGINPDAPISAKNLPIYIPWYNYDATGNVLGFRFDRLPKELLPFGVPYYDDGPPPGIYVDMPGNPPTKILLFDKDAHLPVERLPVDPSAWPGLAAAIIKALQSNAGLMLPGFIPITVPTLDNVSYPAAARLRPDGVSVLQTLTRALPAFTDGGTVSGPLPKPSQGVGNVYTVANGASAAAVRHRAPQNFKDGAKVGSDGAQWFPVTVLDEVAYPLEMERALFTIPVSQRMLARNCRFSVSGLLSLALTGPAAAATRGQYVLRVSFGHKTGPALASVVFDSHAIDETLLFGDSAETHSFAVAIQKAQGADTLTATATFYGRTINVTAPTSQDFIVRGALTRFDLEDVIPVQGQVNASFKGTASVVDLSQPTGN